MGGLLPVASENNDGVMPKSQYYKISGGSGTPLNQLTSNGKHTLSVSASYFTEAGIEGMPGGFGVVIVDTCNESKSYVKQSLSIINNSNHKQLYSLDRITTDGGANWVNGELRIWSN